VHVPLETTKDNVQIIEKIVYKEVAYDTIIEKKVEYIVEKEIQIPVEKIIEVPILITIEIPIFKEKIIEEEVIVEVNPVDI